MKILITFLLIALTQQSSFALQLGQSKRVIDKDLQAVGTSEEKMKEGSFYYVDRRDKNIESIWVRYLNEECIFISIRYKKPIPKKDAIKMANKNLVTDKFKPEIINNGFRYFDKTKKIMVKSGNNWTTFVALNTRLIGLLVRGLQKKKK